jgi:hypothetical protein
MPRAADNGFDAAVVDRSNRAVALVQVKAQPVGDACTTVLPRQVSKSAEQVDFVLTIDPKCIRLYRWAEGALTAPIVELDTSHVLEHYDPDFARRRVFESYLLTLVEAWLRDLSYHWKSEHPPGSAELKSAGLLGRLEGGTTERFGA